ncbi:serine/threonine-protein kinase [Roseicyclus sp. F158]|uniref:Serine/threonine-protein kinase n=1 Tax=Tropicimonas omnivorans TaxID=3075590 RepID=A0ABU3DIM5_9RHOB|nr:serine/threonine-protein kinase [Roseicyclus sp. F158]MDT0683574.1 serine/threonine-protein kinase [Roseicyclus sp. F158]
MLKPHNRAEVNFTAIREIGHEGRNSTTHVVHDVQLDANIVMKCVPKADISDANEYFSESRKLYATAHQNVVPIIYACEDPGHIYIAMPFFENGSLKGLMEDRFLTVREIVRFGCQLLAGIHNIHSKGLIHFDIKPDNVLLSNRKEAMLSDFGLAKQMYLGGAEQNYFYQPIIAPEIFEGPDRDIRFDIYQFGLLLYRMCNGEDVLREHFAQFQSSNEIAYAIRGGTYPNRSTFHEHIPDRLRKVVVRCLEVDPDDRFQSALEVANALATVSRCLDWRFEKGREGKVWKRIDGATEKTFSVATDGTTEFVSYKGGKSRRNREHCCDRMTDARVRRVLKSEG